MAEAQKSGNDALLDMEKELTCSICTDILYQPLALLDCLHTFCGSCLKEWFAWQAAAANNNRRSEHPYTCPSCRESVRGTKADWRLTTLLEGYLKANPDRAKSEAEKEEMREVYKPGDNVIPKVEIRREESDSEDERLMAEVRELSMANVDPETARRRAGRSARDGVERRRRDGGARRHSPDAPGRSPQMSRWAAQQAQLSEANVRQLDGNEPHVENQPSLRSLLSASTVDSHDVQQEILQSILSEGLLEGIDIDNLTPEQEDQLTERIAEAYRRRQRRRDRSGARDQRPRTSHSPRPASSAEQQGRHHARTDSASSQQPRNRPPISRPHLFENTTQPSNTRSQRSASGTSQHSDRLGSRIAPPSTSPAARSATDLTEQTRTAEGRRERHRRMSANARSTTDPASARGDIHRVRATSGSNRDTVRSEVIPTSHPLEAVRRLAGPTNNSTPSLPTTAGAVSSEVQQSIRPALSNAAFAPEVAEPVQASAPAPMVNCNRCGAANIQHDVHYHCPRCRTGTFNICQPCYRNEQGCDYWFGFGFAAEQRWSSRAPSGGYPSSHERPHILLARKYHQPSPSTASQAPQQELQEGAFCDSCSAFADNGYYYCPDCLSGAWGYCSACVNRGHHCSHPLLAVTHLRNIRQPFADPTRATFVPMPHLRPDSYVLSNVPTDCDICHRKISPNNTRFHCYECSAGDYDVCTDCYYGLVATGKIAQANAPNGWRRCLKGHRMAVVGFQDLPYGGQQRVVVNEAVGGWRHKENSSQHSSGANPTPPGPQDQALGGRCIAAYNYFPREAGNDDLVFPKNAEVSEVKEETPEWWSGVYCGKLGLFPSSYVRKS